MKFTRILALALIALMMLSVFAACDNGQKNPEQTTQSTTQGTTQAPTTKEPTTEEPITKEPSSEEPTTEESTSEGSTSEESVPEGSTSEPPVPEITTITIAQALELCGEEGNVTEERYYIRATIKTIVNANYGQMIIADETGEISVYGTYSADGEINYSAMEDKPYRGDEVLLHCILQNFNGTKEVKNARLIEFTHTELDIDLGEYTDMSVANAREADKGTKIKVDGVVAKITFANGYKPNGFFLVDETASIYVFDGNLAQRVSEGDKITIAGEKDYWILDSEQNNAAAFGYKGSCQLANAHLIEQDNSQDYAFDKSWITESCIKDILDAPVTENVTTTIYKVNALVKKVPGQGFVNYYFFDLDGETGNYTYTQCNGGDFEWLDQFDGKICTVYISPINCKSTPSDCFFRLVPIEVIDENFTFDSTKAPAYVLKYHAMKQFATEYAADPALEMITSISSELLGFANATVSYTSSDSNILSFAEESGKIIMHCKNPGTVTVTVSATLGDVTATETVEITVNVTPSIDAGNVKSAIDATAGDIVTVKGIVGPSLVNQVGFYLIDESGAIAVLTTNDIMNTIEVGQEIVISATKVHRVKDGATAFGQSHLGDITILANYYGSHEYSTASFVTDKTIADICGLDATLDQTTTVYVVKGTVSFPSGYGAIEIQSGSNALGLYHGSTAQYSFLEQFKGQEVTLEIAICNWNSKQLKGCVLSVITQDGKILNTLNFDAE